MWYKHTQKVIAITKLSAIWLFLTTSSTAGANSSDALLDELMESYWDARVHASPLLTTGLGLPGLDDQLDDVGPAAREAEKRRMDNALTALAAIDIDELTESNRVNYEVFEWMLAGERRTLDFDAHLFTFNTVGGWHSSFANLPRYTPARTRKNYEDYIARLSKFGRYADQKMTLMREGIEKGYTQPCESIAGYDKSIEGYLADTAEETTFYRPFENIPHAIPSDVQSRFRTAGSDVIERVVLPGYRRYLDFYVNEYEPACRKDVGLSSIPNGAALYDHWVKFFTSMPTNADNAHELGLAEVKRIRKRMLEIIDEVDFEGSFAEFLDELRTDPQHYETDPERYMAIAALIAKRADGQLPMFFSYLPRVPYGLLPIHDAIAPKSPSAYYGQSDLAGKRAGQYYLNLHDLSSRPLYELPALTLHEAVPGHHLQKAIQGELTELPTFRQMSPVSAFAEGWALYAESLGEEMGLYRTPYERFGQLTFEMWRACRLVVDSGIHAKGWSRQRAIDFMAANTALSLHNISTEVDRYITFPGQALAYKHGELKIWELRNRAEAELAEDFSLREFHTAVLRNGDVPLGLLEKLIDRWITEQKNDP